MSPRGSKMPTDVSKPCVRSKTSGEQLRIYLLLWRMLIGNQIPGGGVCTLVHANNLIIWNFWKRIGQFCCVEQHKIHTPYAVFHLNYVLFCDVLNLTNCPSVIGRQSYLYWTLFTVVCKVQIVFCDWILWVNKMWIAFRRLRGRSGRRDVAPTSCIKNLNITFFKF